MVECLEVGSTSGIEPVFHRINPHTPPFLLEETFILAGISVCIILNFIETFNTHSKTNVLKMLNVWH
jgi:hypothetical protein